MKLATTTERVERAPRADRSTLLDVLRGVAILGTLATNVWIFAHPGGERRILTDLDALSPLTDTVAETTFRLLANGKFLALLTILFGVGLAIQHRSATRRGEPWPGRYPWRAALLFVEGTLHFLLVFAFDVLMGYAVAALVVARLLSRSSRAQQVAMWLAGGIHLSLMLLVTAALLAAPDEGTAVADTRYPQESYADQFAFRLDNATALRAEPVFAFGLVVFLFLLGVRLFRAGAFGTDATGRRLRRRLLIVGLGVGLPLNVATTLAGPDLVMIDRYVLPPLVALGYLGLVGTLLDRVTRPGVVSVGLAGVGRTALSCYVTQNVICAVVCYGWGLGLATALDGARPWWVFGLWTAVCGLLVIGAYGWLRRFRHGPLEAAQRWMLARLPG